MDTLRPSEKQISCICFHLMENKIEAGEGAITWLEKELDRFTASSMIKAFKEGKDIDGINQLIHLGLPVKKTSKLYQTL